jgi:hypothetical protein
VSKEEHLTEMIRIGQEARQADIELGARQERERIIKLLKPYAEHSELCSSGCYPEDCNAPEIQYLIQKIQETDFQENVNNNGHKEG